VVAVVIAVSPSGSGKRSTTGTPLASRPGTAAN
jgi:hypothetical protein